GIIGKFMFYLPLTLIVTLLGSLLVAYIMNPVFAVTFMKAHDARAQNNGTFRSHFRKLRVTTIVFVALAIVFYAAGVHGMGNLTLFVLFLVWMNRLFIDNLTKKFQTSVWPRFQDWFEGILTWCLQGWRPAKLMGWTVLLFIFTIALTIVRQPPVEFFPNADPNFVYAYITTPVGTDQKVTDSITRIVENRVWKVIGEKNPVVESVISNVAVGATDPSSGDRSAASNRGKVTVAFVKFAERDGESTQVYLDKIREAVKGIPLAEITVDKEANGPPTGKPINIEIAGDNFDDLIRASEGLRKYLDSLNIPGVEKLRSDLQKLKPEIVIDIDRERANREGISTGQIGMAIRSAVYGVEVSQFREANDEYPIQLRYNYEQRNNINALMNMPITYRDMNMGGAIRNVPLSAVADIKYANALGGITRKNQKRLVTVYSNVLGGFNPNDVVAQVQTAAANYKMPDTVTMSLTGEQEEQKETAGFLGTALLVSLGLIFLILVTQFNSVSKPFIILTEIVFSIIGVLLGLAITGMTISIVMTGVGIVALAGIVVRNGILLIEFADVLRERGFDIRTAAIKAGRVRMTPVLLTASATILGLIPLAVGMNIDFVKLFEEGNPHIWFGGESVAFWGPLSWTIIFGLSFATIITLVLVPAMYLMVERRKLKFKGRTDVPVKAFNEAELAEI
ncbi:MAG TPA: efflux RND transporter permease subunit, partial [Chitinophagales bacterium]|nr:efflux RND transporter permease subunit [Chitinophagales bacterium]